MQPETWVEETQNNDQLPDNWLVASLEECTPLEPEEFLLLHEVWAKSGNQAIRHDLMRRNLRLAYKVAGKSSAIGMPLLDRFQEAATEGLNRALVHFDRTRGVKWVTFASRCMRGAIWRAYYANYHDVRLPENIGELASKVLKARRRLTSSLKRIPTIEEIAESLGIDVEKIEDAIWITSKWTTSLDGMEERDERLPASNANTAAPAETKSVFETVARVLETLSDRDRIIAWCRIFWHLIADKKIGVVETGKMAGIGKSRVGQLEEKLRERLPLLFREFELRGASS